MAKNKINISPVHHITPTSALLLLLIQLYKFNGNEFDGEKASVGILLLLLLFWVPPLSRFYLASQAEFVLT